jgi:Collagen triple helix repeat (20 copies)
MADDTITDIVVVRTVETYVDVLTPGREAVISIVAPPTIQVDIADMGGPMGPEGPPGPQGPEGDQGLPGSGFIMKGTVPNWATLPPDPNVNDGYVTADTGHFWVWNGTEWVDCGDISGPQGPQGDQGPPGPFGPEGPVGPPGPEGQQGIQGPPGQNGADSFVPGPQGPKGDQGPIGPVGPVGPIGPEGPTGPQGPQGQGMNIKGTVPNAGALPPTGNQINDAWVAADTSHVWVWNGTSWVDLGPITAGSATHTTDAAPSGAAQGDLWWETDTGLLWIRYDNSWVEAQPVGIGDAPEDGSYYVRKNAGWVVSPPPGISQADADVRFVNVTGDTLTGPLVLPGNPSAALQAAPKQYVDAADTALAATDAVLAGKVLPPGGAINQILAKTAATDFAVAWVTASGGGGGGAATSIGDTPPVSPVAGQLWWESDSGILYIYFNDGDTSQWVQASAGPGATNYPDRIISTSLDMSFRPSGANAYALNSKADGSGFNILKATKTGILSIDDEEIGLYGTGGNAWVWNSKADATGTDFLRLTNTGSLSLSGVGASCTMILNKPAGAWGNVIWGQAANLARWNLQLGDGAAEGSGTVGSDFSLSRYNNAGTYIDSPFAISRGSGGIAPNTTFNATKALASFNAAVRMSACFEVDDDSGGMSIANPSTGALTHFAFDGPGSNVGIATRNIAGGSATHLYVIYYTAANGSITTAGSGTAFNTTSDERLKVNIKETRATALGRELVDALKVVAYEPLELEDRPEGHVRAFDRLRRTRDGVNPPTDPIMLSIPAQQAYTVYPEAVTPPDDAMPGYDAKAAPGEDGFHPWMLDYSKFVPMLIANLQEANERIDDLEDRIAKLEAMLVP